MVALIAVEGLVYFAAVIIVLRFGSSRYSTSVVILIAIIMRFALVFNHPVLSTDIYRYVWDGQVQFAGINPYRYIPIDPALNSLRDPKVFPHINRSSYARTIYPPAAQIIFAFVGRITSTVTGMKIAMVAFEALACLCVLRLLEIAKLPRERLLIYAWNPLAQWSFAADGHVDAAAIGLLALALLCRIKRRDGLAGAVLAAATLIKFLPLVVSPAFVRGGWFWRPAIVGAATIVLLYACYASAGANVLGFLPGYGAEEGLNDGHGIWLLAGLSYFVKLPRAASILYLFAAATAFALLSIWIVRRQPPREQNEGVTLCRDTALLAACAMIVISPHYPWYFVWLALPSVVAPAAGIIWLSTAPRPSLS